MTSDIKSACIAVGGTKIVILPSPDHKPFIIDAVTREIEEMEIECNSDTIKRIV